MVFLDGTNVRAHPKAAGAARRGDLKPSEYLASRVGFKLKATDVIDVLSDPFIWHGVPGHVQSNN
ncbi:hypothetical protein GGQ76_004173 [Aureimonas jatrophae]|uniref:Transposase n=1 Tax=Aureimonas jatrophae TaxID=1166073 RepID=A0A1H0EG67_9HYPH|nr:hypothetical protein [Aureimonas jatrophae]SDN81311.1 hypothetical protein SAMN05192530_10222 [Aureimonas jatrophae]